MKPGQKTFGIFMWSMVVVGLFALVAMNRFRNGVQAEADPAIPSFRLDPSSAPTTQGVVPAFMRDDQAYDIALDAPTFVYTNQAGEQFSSDRLRGKVWTGMFFFSYCTGVCPSMKKRVVDLQETVTDARVHFVSFSVDPTNDTPERLAAYAKSAKADPARWHMLTGTDEQTRKLADAVKLPYDNAVDHSARIFLVDQQGVIRRYYESTSDKQMKQLAADASALAETGNLPANPNP
jgi:protein SCO1